MIRQHRFRKVRFPIIFLPRKNEKPALNSFGLKCVFEKLRFRDGLVWTVGLTVELVKDYIKAVFSNFSGPVWTLAFKPRLHDEPLILTSAP